MVGWPRGTILDRIGEFGDFQHLTESAKAAASHATDFEAPEKQQNKTR
jgi:hypothetical protein